ncbi:NUDIX domain-containing protein [Candidatus Parcubacteria bacterium]|nr:NUDIX domain-containing protein [Candidatus Parcubacteria bacterium]
MDNAEKEELLDLVDSQDQVIGTITRSKFQAVIANPPGYIRASEAFIMNRQGQLWVPRRTADKTIAPNGLDFSCAEHVQSGETYLEAMMRGFAEELNMLIQAEDLELKQILKPEPKQPMFRAIYVHRSDNVPSYNPEDFTEYRWLHPQEAVELIKAGEAAKPNLAPAIEEVFLNL